MGGIITKPDSLSTLQEEAYQLLSAYYGYLLSLQQTGDYEDEALMMMFSPESESTLSTYLQECFQAAVEDLQRIDSESKDKAATTEVDHDIVLLTSCSCPAILCALSLQIQDENRSELHHRLKEILISESKSSSSSAAKAVDSDGYAKSFGGTAEDSRVEREAAALLRGSESGVRNEQSKLRSPIYRTDFEERVLRKVGSYIRYQGSECVMYFHTLCRTSLSVRPSEYIDDSSDVAISIDVTAKNKSDATEIFNGLPICSVENLTTYVDDLISSQKKTPLIIDMTTEKVVRSYYSYKGHLADVSSLTIPFAKAGTKRGDIVENCRKQLVAAIKNGSVFCMYLGEMTAENANFKQKLCKKDTFPVETFVNGGAKLLDTYMGKKRFEEIFREPDLEAGQAIARDGFKVVVITTLAPKVYEAALEETMPLGYMFPFVVTSSCD